MIVVKLGERDSGRRNVLLVVGFRLGKLDLIERMEIELLTNCTAYVAAPDDVIIAKLRYYLDGGSDKHLRDIAGILKHSGDLIDTNYVTAWAAQHGAATLWSELQARAAQG